MMPRHNHARLKLAADVPVFCNAAMMKNVAPVFYRDESRTRLSSPEAASREASGFRQWRHMVQRTERSRIAR